MGDASAVCAPSPTTGTAYAANGALFINGRPYIDPSGCYPIAYMDGYVEIWNSTDIDATVYREAGCTGAVVGTVRSKNNFINTTGPLSLYIR